MASSRKIRFIVISLHTGGTEVHLTRLLPQLKRRGWEPHVIALTHKGELAPILEEVGIKILAPPRWLQFVTRRRILSNPLTLPLSLAYLILQIRRTDAGVTCFYLPAAYLLGTAAIYLAGEKTRTVMFRRSMNEYHQKRWPLGLIERWLHKRQGALVANSRMVARQMIDDEHAPADRVCLIYNGVDLTPYEEAGCHRNETRHTLGIESAPFVMGIIGNLLFYKGHLDLLNALGTITRELPSGWRLLCIGAGLECRPDLRKTATQLGIEHNILWLGSRNDVPKLLAACDVFLLVSHEEGFSNALLEGMAAGLPVIVTDVGGNPEAVSHGETGILVPSHDPAAIARAILEFWRDPARAKAQGDAAKTRVRLCFSLDRCLERYELLFRSLTSGQNGIPTALLATHDQSQTQCN